MTVPSRVVLTKLHIWCPECKVFKPIRANEQGMLVCGADHVVGVYRP